MSSALAPLEVPAEGETALQFGPFRLLPDRRLLLRDGMAVDLGSRAFDLLLALIRRPGDLARKADLIAQVWPGMRVEDVNLRVHLSLLRKALGDGQDGQRYIVTIPGQGYRFVCPVLPLNAVAAPPNPAGALPRRLTRMVGREQVVEAILLQLRTWRCLTLVGAGGIGKTTLVTHVAEQLRPDYPDGVTFVDLSSLTRDELVVSAVAFALGIASFSDDPTPGILAFLQRSRRLLVLDNCERVVAGVATLAEQMLRGAPKLQILATSREPLHIEGEWILRVPPLGMPPSARLTAAEALAYPAVQLFAERVAAVLDGYELVDADVPAVVAICARLAGIALAIELAAAHAAAFDLNTLADLLLARFRLIARGRRTAVPRHQTMQAVLDWSYATIALPEQMVLRRLGVFEGSFTLAAAQAVASGDAEADISLSLADLVDKSLVTTRPGDAGIRFCLLDLTRAYALDRLAESGERHAVARRHALYCLAVFRAAEAAWSARTIAQWLAEIGPELGNVRAALDWAFAPAGDAMLGVELATVAVPLLFELSLAEECRRRAAQALRILGDIGGAADGQIEMRLRATLGAALTYTPGPVPQTVQTWQEVLSLATRLDDPSIRSRAVWGLWTAHCYGGRPRQALEQAAAFAALSTERGDQARQVLADRLTGIALHYLGEQDAAHALLQEMLARYAPDRHRWQTLGFAIDHRPMAKATLARILWLQGRPAEALCMNREALSAVQSQGHAISICYVLTEATIPLALMARDDAAATSALRLLEEVATQNGLAIWQAAARFTQLAARLARGDRVGLAPFREALSALQQTGYTLHAAWLCGIAAEAFAEQGELSGAATLVEEALATCARTEEGWARSELLRVQAQIVLATTADAAAAEALLLRARDLAARQHALAWELRATLALARLPGRSGPRTAARDGLPRLLRHFAPGMDTADMSAARALLRP